MASQVMCPEPGRLFDLLEGMLPPDQRDTLSRHLDHCALCQQTLESLASAGQPLPQGAPEPAQHSAYESALQQVMEHLENQTFERETPATKEQKDQDISFDFLSPSDQPGHLGKLGHYDVTEMIGRGGMGIVLKAFDEQLHRVVAIKVMAPELATNATARKRFVREARAAAGVRDEHVIDIHAVEEAGPLPYLVMEYVLGKSLQERLDETGPLELKEILRLGHQIACGLAAAHAQNLIHRDIKPANILLQHSVDRVKITDFGLARAVDDASISQSGIVAGTPQYMSPEQARGEPVDHRSDLFSLGSVLYAMCTGRAPFRAHNTVAVLRRVSDDQTRPIREINPDIPDWLVAIVEKLHAKEPEQRFQTAAEVAELLGQHLAQLQQPIPRVAGAEALRSPGETASRVAAPAGASKTQPRPPTGVALLASKQWHTRRWVAAAAVLLVLIGSLAVTEATGVTKITDFVATTLRITTPEGTLIVEVDDPNVKVTIEGDGGLVITGAGPQEVRLKPGSYKVEASKDGKPVKSEVVTITRNGKKVVTVQIEGPPAGAAGQAEKQAFVVLGGKGVAERKFDTLAAVVLAASDGDTIEIRGNGPFVTEPVVINHALTIRAGKGFRPVIKLSPEGVQGGANLLQTSALLVLEGLELHRVSSTPNQEAPAGWPVIVYSQTAPLHIANCRFVLKSLYHFIGHESPVCELRNCELLCAAVNGAVQGGVLPKQRWIVDNCVIGAPGGGFGAMYRRPDANQVSIQLTRNTAVTEYPPCAFALETSPQSVGADVLRLEASGNIFNTPSSILHFEQSARIYKEEPLSAQKAEALASRLLDWHGQQNLYSVSSPMLSQSVNWKNREPASPLTRLDDWKRFWESPETGSQQGRVRFQGGDLLGKVRVAAEQLTPEDFRLRPDSAGYRAGKDGKDLGADIDLVGPGAAYERWKQTPEYQQWLKDTGQLRAEAPKPEPKAFVVLGGKGVAERKFDTLAEAVQGASDGDTIEIRGNGPFVTPPISLKKALTIRAGERFQPTLQLDARRAGPLLTTDVSLVLEGIEFLHQPGNDAPVQPWSPTLSASGAVLQVANCRFVRKANVGGPCVHCASITRAEFRNSQFTRLGGTPGTGISYRCPPRGTLLVENCADSASYPLGLMVDATKVQHVTISLRNNTWAAGHGIQLILSGIPPGPILDSHPAEAPLVTMESAQNVFDFRQLFMQVNDSEVMAAPPPKETLTEACRRFVAWRDEGSLYPSQLLLGVEDTTKGNHIAVDGQAAWVRFWNLQPTAARSGRPKFQGGDVYALTQTAAQALGPEDFRLRPDSAGYKAGKDGKDLGADVDLVGPGAAYERWKKTPEYQQWLKDTGQLREGKP